MQEWALLAVAAVLIIVVVSYAAPKLGVAAPVLLVLVGMGCSQLPGAPHLVVEPEWILVIVLPPILYSAAVNVPVVDFRRNFATIGALSVLLVAVSAFGTGLLIWWLLPEIGFAAALALGAVISPPDAVAATSIGKKLGLPPRLVTILEGEGLVNDATALVLLRTAIVAITASVSFGSAVGDFAYAVSVGVVIGAAVGIVSVWARSKIQGQPVLTTAISYVVPFLAFIPAEEVHSSGVIAVVVAGLITGHQSAKRFTAHDRISERTNWRTIQLILENGVFLLVGFELTSVVATVADDDLARTLVIGALATVALVLLRGTFVIPLIAMLRRQQRRADAFTGKLDSFLDRFLARGPEPGNEKRYERGVRMLQRKQADVAFYASEGLSWRGGAVLAWSGMRGVVTVAAAQTLPEDLPFRNELILIAFTVAILTLVVQGGSLPLVIRWLGIRGNDEDHERREYARLAGELVTASRTLLESSTLCRENGEPFDERLLEQTLERTIAMSEGIEKKFLEQDPDKSLHQRFELQRMMTDAQQNALLDARAGGTYASHTLERAQTFVDSQSARFM
ncbi:cation:proton antiporter [Lentzea sp. NPDC102401]|uniref:cation:proton antiporter n=1 Tax=Lentzea sp. NPDC102401 TaxID=3364128 RepID=UPI0038148441